MIFGQLWTTELYYTCTTCNRPRVTHRRWPAPRYSSCPCTCRRRSAGAQIADLAEKIKAAEDGHFATVADPAAAAARDFLNTYGVSNEEAKKGVYIGGIRKGAYAALAAA